MRDSIYLDHHATTPLDPAALAAMLPFLESRFGNPASRTHCFGQDAAEAVAHARESVARLVGAAPREVIFTSGATESDNLALFGIVEAARISGRTDPHLIVGATEHVAVLDPAQRLEERGVAVTRVAVDRWGRVDPDDVSRSVRSGTVLVSLMTANNEVGTLHPLAEIGRRLRALGVPLHSDASQAAGRIPLDAEGGLADLLSLSAHKVHGPKGVGALVVREVAGIRPLARVLGGGHERGLRSGTANVPAIVGFGAAAAIALDRLHDDARRLARLCDTLFERLRDEVGGVERNGHPVARLPNNLHLTIDGVDGEALATGLGSEVALSTGSACASAAPGPSHVLRAMGLTTARAAGSIRIGLGRFTTDEEIERAGARIAEEIRRLRAISSGPPFDSAFGSAQGKGGLPRAKSRG